MSYASARQIAATYRSHASDPTQTRAMDTSGYGIFSKGDAGNVHVTAHRMLDQGRIVLGYERLSAWLEGRTGSGSDWAHLQFHMAIFELGVGDWHAARDRFLAEILPVAATTEDALTDAPGLLWRLALTRPESVELPWGPLRRTALQSMQRIHEPFVALHQVLALAGARDREGIDKWLRIHASQIRTYREKLAVETAAALRAYVEEDYEAAAVELQRLTPLMPKVGGSRAQNELFKDLAADCWKRARVSSAARRHA